MWKNQWRQWQFSLLFFFRKRQQHFLIFPCCLRLFFLQSTKEIFFPLLSCSPPPMATHSPFPSRSIHFFSHHPRIPPYSIFFLESNVQRQQWSCESAEDGDERCWWERWKWRIFSSLKTRKERKRLEVMMKNEFPFFFHTFCSRSVFPY